MTLPDRLPGTCKKLRIWSNYAIVLPVIKSILFRPAWIIKRKTFWEIQWLHKVLLCTWSKFKYKAFGPDAVEASGTEET